MYSSSSPCSSSRRSSSSFALPAFLVFGYLVRSLAPVDFTFGLALFVLVPLGAFIDFWVYLVTVYLFGVAYREAVGGAVETSATPA